MVGAFTENMDIERLIQANWLNAKVYKLAVNGPSPCLQGGSCFW
jgi:hypothetical protein